MKSVYVYPPKMMADATLSKDNPVSAMLYTVLCTTKNVRIISMSAAVMWTTTQPTPLEIVVTVDGLTQVYIQTNPVDGMWYISRMVPFNPETAQAMHPRANNYTDSLQLLHLEGRSVKVQVRITWATTQPTSLVCKVKYAKY